MAAISSRPALVAIVGPTASGKTGLAVDIAEQAGGEIICADSRTVYTGMDIGTAKPTAEERRRVPHWGLDLSVPGERFTAADFKAYAVAKIAEITERGRTPFLVGGSGLYIDGVLLDYEFGPERDAARRQELEGWSLEELWRYCRQQGVPLPENRANRRYVIRAIERHGLGARRRDAPPPDVVVVGVRTDPEVLRARIAARARLMLARHVVDEALRLAGQYGWDNEAMTGNVYRAIRRYTKGEVSEEGLVRLIQAADWQLARRQTTWFKRRNFIQWFSREDAVLFLRRRLLAHE